MSTTTTAHMIPTAADFECVKYGVPIANVNEDEDYVMLGHHEERRIVAAMNAYWREELGSVLCSTYEDIADPISQHWAVFTNGDETVDWAWHFEYCDEGTPDAVAVTRWLP